MIEHTAWRADDDRDAVLEIGNLLAHGRAAVKQRDTGTLVFCNTLDLTGHLDGEFTRRAKDERLRERGVGTHELVDERQREGGGFSGSRSRLNEQIAACGGRCPHVALNPSGLGVAHGFEGLENLGGQAERSE